jgi:hypothetical protein
MWPFGTSDDDKDDVVTTAEVRQYLQEQNCRCYRCGVHQGEEDLYLEKTGEDYAVVCGGCTNQPERMIPEHKPGRRGYLPNLLGGATRRKQNTGEEVQIKTSDEGNKPYAGRYPRSVYESDNGDILLGYGKTVDMVNPKGIKRDDLTRHVSIFGTTGTGKSTLLEAVLLQHAYAGYGFCFVDPKGESAENLLKRLPHDRLDDVVWVEPGNTRRDRTVAINPLEVQVPPDHPRHDEAIESTVTDLKDTLKDDDYWGPRIDGITSNVATAAMMSSRNYTLLDLYFVLINEERRELFADRVQQENHPFVEEYTRKIAEMDDEKIDAVVRRLQSWIESPLARQVVAHKESSIDFQELLDGDAIVLVKNDADTEDIQRMVTTVIARKLWSAVQTRDGTRPYYFIIDELENIMSDELNLKRMFSQARSHGLGVTVATQQPSQLSEKRQKEVMGANTVISFSVSESRDAELLADRLVDVEPDEIIKIQRYRAWMQRDGRTDKMNTFPPYPAVHTDEKVQETVEKSLERHGATRLTDEEILDTSEITPSNDGRIEREMVRAVDDLVDNGWIPVDSVDERLRRRARYTRINEQRLEETELARVRESTRYLKTRQTDGKTHATLTDEGKTLIANESDTGPFGGGDTHRSLVKLADEVFTSLGCVVELPHQDTNELPDAIINIPDETDVDELAHYLAGAKLQNGEVEYDDRKINVEVEASLSKPAQTLDNLRKAIEEDRRCIYVVPEHQEDSSKNADRLRQILRGARGDEQGRLYNSRERIEFDEGFPLIPEKEETSWYRTEDGYSLRIGDETIELDSPDELNASVYTYPVATHYGDSYRVEDGDETGLYASLEELKEDWNLLRKPYTTEDLNADREDYEILVASDRKMSVYESGELLEFCDAESLKQRRDEIIEQTNEDNSVEEKGQERDGLDDNPFFNRNDG